MQYETSAAEPLLTIDSFAPQTKDATDPPSTKEERKAVDFKGPVDSVYLDTPGYVELDVGTGAETVNKARVEFPCPPGRVGHWDSTECWPCVVSCHVWHRPGTGPAVVWPCKLCMPCSHVHAALQQGNVVGHSATPELTKCMPLSCVAGAAVAITASEWDDVVVWTPWTDMDCYRSFCCVENAKFKPVTVAPGDSWRAQTTLEIKDL